MDLELETGDSLFANLWRAFCNMRAALLKQLSVDPTWGNNMASMIFAAEALTNIKFDADIPFWLDDVITFDGQTKEAYKFLIDYCNRTFIMSYRDTAQGIYDVAKDELEYAKTVNKMLFLGVETGDEEDVVTFAQENKQYMYDELKKLYNLVDYNYGLSIHHIKSWYELKSD